MIKRILLRKQLEQLGKSRKEFESRQKKLQNGINEINEINGINGIDGIAQQQQIEDLPKTRVTASINKLRTVYDKAETYQIKKETSEIKLV